MACRHKFADDLNLTNLDFKPLILIVGTFNPDWEILNNTAQWFYGRTHNNYFWEILPRLYGEASLRQALPQAWRVFCRNRQIAITDLISQINDADSDNSLHVGYLKTYRDDLIARHFKNFEWVKIVELLQRHPTIQQVYLTRKLHGGFWQRLWHPVANYCDNAGIYHKTLLTPSGGARFQMPKSPLLRLQDFILSQWQQDWLSINSTPQRLK